MDHRLKCKIWNYMKLSEKDIDEHIWNREFLKKFLDLTLKGWSMKENIDKLDLTQSKNLCSVKLPIKRKRSLKVKENMCKPPIWQRGSI